MHDSLSCCKNEPVKEKKTCSIRILYAEAVLPAEMQAPLQSILDHKLIIVQASLVMQRDHYWCCGSSM